MGTRKTRFKHDDATLSARRAEETRLVDQAREGCEVAFRRLMERHQRRTFTVAMSVLKDADDATDATQEAFVRVHRSLTRFNGESTFWTWLYRIVLNVCIDVRRRQKRVPMVAYEEERRVDDDVAAVVPLHADMSRAHPARAYEQSELVDMVKVAFDHLTEAHRTILTMREIDGLSYAEIAERLGCAPGTVMSRLHHARRNFRKSLNPYLERGALPHRIIMPGVEAAA